MPINFIDQQNLLQFNLCILYAMREEYDKSNSLLNNVSRTDVNAFNVKNTCFSTLLVMQFHIIQKVQQCKAAMERFTPLSFKTLAPQYQSIIIKKMGKTIEDKRGSSSLANKKAWPWS